MATIFVQWFALALGVVWFFFCRELGRAWMVDLINDPVPPTNFPKIPAKSPTPPPQRMGLQQALQVIARTTGDLVDGRPLPKRVLLAEAWRVLPHGNVLQAMNVLGMPLPIYKQGSVFVLDERALWEKNQNKSILDRAIRKRSDVVADIFLTEILIVRAHRILGAEVRIEFQDSARYEATVHIRYGDDAGPVVFAAALRKTDELGVYFELIPKGQGYLSGATVDGSGWVVCDGWVKPKKK